VHFPRIVFSVWKTAAVRNMKPVVLYGILKAVQSAATEVVKYDRNVSHENGSICGSAAPHGTGSGGWWN
jgi:hypothetical protein